MYIYIHIFEEDDREGESDQGNRLKDQAESVEDVQRRESYQKQELESPQPDELNELEVVLF